MNTIWAAIVLISFVVDIGLCTFAMTRVDRERHLNFAILCVALLIYNLGYLVELQATTAGEMHIALIVENFAILLIAPFYYLTTRAFFQGEKGWVLPLVAANAYSLSMFLVVLTNPLHNSYYSSVEAVWGGKRYHSLLTYGPLFSFNQIISMGLILLSFWILFRSYKTAGKRQRKQILYYAGGGLAPTVVSALNVLHVLPVGMDLTPVAMTAAMLLFALSFMRVDPNDTVARARNNAVETMETALILVDADGSLLYCNAFGRMIFPKLVDGRQVALVDGWPQGLMVLNDEGDITFSLEHDGALSYYQAQVRHLLRRSEVIGHSINISDITESTELIRKLEEQATIDGLTQIANRRHFYESIRRELKIAERFRRTSALISFDIDHFKSINDTYGHPIGDLVLQQLSSTVTRQLRAYDIFGRVGGEEFMVFTQSEGEEQVFVFAERLRKTVENIEVVTEKGIITFTASFGVCEIAPGSELELAVAKADEALYRAKQKGRNRVEWG